MGSQLSQLTRYRPEPNAPELSFRSKPHSYSDEEVLLYIRSVQLDQFEFPIELVLHIANFIADNRLRALISLASKWLFSNFWASVSEYTDSPLRPIQHPSYAATQSYILSKLVSVEDLTIHPVWDRYDDAVVAAIYRCAPTLRRLILGPSDKEKYIRFIEADDLAGVPFPRLQVLNARRLSHRTFRNILENAKHLKHITFPNGYSLSMFSMVNEFVGVPAGLETVSCLYPVTFGELEAFKVLKSLRRITVSANEYGPMDKSELLAENDTNKLLTEYKRLRRQIDNASAHPDVQIFLDQSDYYGFSVNIYNLILSSMNQALIQILLNDSTLSQHQLDLMFREFLVHSAYKYDYHDELMFIVDYFLKRDVDLSTPVHVPSLGMTQTPFELLFRHCASMKLIKDMFFSPIGMPSLSSEPLTRFQIVRKQSPDYPFFWAQSLYFSCATGFSDPHHIIEVLEYLETSPSDLIDATGGALDIGSAFKANYREFFPIHQVRHAQVAEHLLDLGADPLALDSCHHWPAMAYAALRSADLLRALTKRLEGRGPFVFIHESGMSIFDLVCQEPRLMKGGVFSVLLDVGQRPGEESLKGLVDFVAYGSTVMREEDFQVGLRAVSVSPDSVKMEVLAMAILIFSRVTKITFPSDDGEFEKLRQRLASMFDAWMNAHEEDADRFVDSLSELESRITSKLDIEAPIAHLMCVFALPTQFSRLVSICRAANEEQRAEFESIVDEWKDAHLFSSMIHISSDNLGHIKHYFLVASILSELEILSASSFDPHIIDFLLNPISTDLWRGYLASCGFNAAS